MFYCLKGKKQNRINKFASGNFCVCVCVCVCFYETKNIYSHTHSTYAGGQMLIQIHQF